MRFLAVMLLLAGLLAGCSSGVAVDTPPEIRYGEESCDQCRMIINEARFAAAYVTRSGTVRRFDDIGNMLLFDAARGEEVVVFWVHDYDTAAWLKAPQAFFVVKSGILTPMGHGIVAVKDHARARELAVAGAVLSFAQLRDRLRQDGVLPGAPHQHGAQTPHRDHPPHPGKESS